MALEFRKTTFLKVYTGEDVMLGDIPLYKAIIHEARRLKLAGGTITKGIGGYASSNIRGVNRALSSFVSGNANYPVIVEIVDNRENIEKILPFLEKHSTHALVLVEESKYLVTDYMRSREQAMAQQKSKQAKRQNQQQQ